MEGRGEFCCVCGRALPNRWAVAGRCEADGCGSAFCALHWHRGNRRCPAHGWKQVETNVNHETEKKMPEKEHSDETNDREMQARAEQLPAARKTSILKQLGSFAVSLGHGAGSLLKKISGYRSPAEAMADVNAQIDVVRAAREPLSRRLEELYADIVAKKKVFQSAAPARRRILEMELKSAVAEYQSLERQIAAYLKNETVLVKVKGRMNELVAMNLKAVSEGDIDKLTDRIEEAADAGQDIDGAIDGLDKAGRRAERADDSFVDELAAFGDDIADPPAAETSASETTRRDDPLSDF